MIQQHVDDGWRKEWVRDPVAGDQIEEFAGVWMIKPQLIDHRREAAVKQQQAAIERIEDELVFGRLVAWIDRTPDGTGARNAEHAGKGDRIVAGQDRDFLPGGNAGISESACDPIAKALHVTIAQVLSFHGQAWSISTKRRALIQIVDKPHELPPGKKVDGAVRTRHPVASIVNRQNWVHHQSEASQLA